MGPRAQGNWLGDDYPARRTVNWNCDTCKYDISPWEVCSCSFTVYDGTWDDFYCRDYCQFDDGVIVSSPGTNTCYGLWNGFYNCVWYEPIGNGQYRKYTCNR